MKEKSLRRAGGKDGVERVREVARGEESVDSEGAQ
jgi:hypothetical protein